MVGLLSVLGLTAVGTGVTLHGLVPDISFRRCICCLIVLSPHALSCSTEAQVDNINSVPHLLLHLVLLIHTYVAISSMLGMVHLII